MIISISGPCSTGKTTTINEIKKLASLGGYEKIVIITETVRELWARDFAHRFNSVEKMLSDKDATMQWTEAVSFEIKNHIQQELEKIDIEKSLVVLDRCCLDHFVYTITNTMKFGITMKTLSIVLENFTQIDEKINLMFRTEIPKNDYFEDDGIRPLNLEDNRSVENNFFRLLFSKQAILLPYDINDRIKIINDEIIKYKISKA